MTTPKKPKRPATARKPAGTPAAKAGRSSPSAGRRAAAPGPARKTAAKASSKPAPKPGKASSARGAKGPAKTQAGHASEIAARLARAVPDALCELRFESPFQLLIATILSAQSTDKAVNSVTPALFARYPTPAALAASDPDDVETLIKRTGFFRAKTKSIRGTAQKLVDEFGSEVPRSIEELIRLPGVARKTSNVVLGTAYGIAAGFVVDTHVTRVSQRLGLTEESDPVKIEQALCALFPREQWVDMGHRTLLHGRYTCLARAPRCEECPLNELCPTRLTDLTTGPWQALADQEAERVRAGMAASA